jgi:IclR family pca regulon transcriptional regulator
MSAGLELVNKRAIPLVLRQGRSKLYVTTPRSRHQTIPSETGVHTNDPNFMMSLARGLQVAQALSWRKRPSTVSQISTDTGLSRAVVRRCLYTLTQLGCAGCNDRRRFFLIPEALWGPRAPQLL